MTTKMIANRARKIRLSNVLFRLKKVRLKGSLQDEYDILRDIKKFRK